jgi:hypothetical protein
MIICAIQYRKKRLSTNIYLLRTAIVIAGIFQNRFEGI